MATCTFMKYAHIQTVSQPVYLHWSLCPSTCNKNQVNTIVVCQPLFQSLMCSLVSLWLKKILLVFLLCMGLKKTACFTTSSFCFKCHILGSHKWRWPYFSMLAETSHAVISQVTLQNWAWAIAIHQPEIMRAQEVSSKDTATHSLLQQRRQSMIQPEKAPALVLPWVRLVLNNVKTEQKDMSLSCKTFESEQKET